MSTILFFFFTKGVGSVQKTAGYFLRPQIVGGIGQN